MPPYIVAEVNTSHNGNIELAKEMIDSIKKAGCNCVKFQSWSAESLYSASFYKENPIAKRMMDKFSFSAKELHEIAEYCAEKMISFCSTPYSKKEVDFLVEKCNVPYIKIASMDINNYPFIGYIASTGMPIVMSTGMGSIEEIHKAVEVVAKKGNKNLSLLHCVSMYPTEASDVKLQNIIGLREAYPTLPIGFSDHSLGVEMASAAAALGAAMIEKHFTLDRAKIGMDNQMAIEPVEMKKLVQNCHNINVALGDKRREISEAEMLQRNKMRRSVVATRDLKGGHILELEDMDSKRPGIGLEPEMINRLVGKKLRRDIKSDFLILEEDIAPCSSVVTCSQL
jgi:N-acetylneuraminate synthase